ncbi:hypothetical protein SAMN05216196_102460 [Lutimaribacter pacificus]|uniref:Thymidylate kinase n=1 Tax=Lutimaribacter pacificus TaxID=391948 RepID=A0A1H0F422_9RHOB|nr:hypothetical protein [Lutimaribacter pacificus]SDN89331.1 hypothetical protein SAMN05216196_102460 [Lutimaribacter pacificus]SHK44516.1 hypothetical protein SAMN05444142_105174 [Lutimaribacter pacificus]
MPFAKEILRKCADFAGLEIRRKPVSDARLDDRPRTGTAGLIVEFIGAQGIGKTTIYNSVHGHIRDHWFFRPHLQNKVPPKDSLSPVSQLHRNLYFQKIRRIETSGANPWRSIARAQQMARVASESLFISSHDFPRGFVLEEGLFKNFPEEILESDAEASHPLWSGRIFVYLRARDPGVVVSRWQQRASARGKILEYQHSIRDSDVRRRVETETTLYDRMIERARDMGRPVLRLEAEDKVDENVRRVLDFERQWRGRVDA